MSNEVAPEGKAYVCPCCGKVSRDQYGYKAHSYGWDESCMLNCRLTDDPVYVTKLQAVEAKAHLDGARE